MAHLSTAPGRGTRLAALTGQWQRPVGFALAVVLLAGATAQAVEFATSEWGRAYAFANGDIAGYLDGARRFLATGSPYEPSQLVAGWQLDPHSFIHPPHSLALFLPFLALPLPMWWLLPLALTGWMVASARPAPWTWPVMALCLAWPRSVGALLTGNSDIWAMAFVAAGIRWGWPYGLLVMKPTFLPLALLGARNRATWAGLLVAGAASVLLLPLVTDWLTVIRHSEISQGPAYSLLNLPLLLIPLVAWLGRDRPGAFASPASD